MPALTFVAVVGLALVALLFVAGATLEPSSPLIATSERVGLPERWRPETSQPPTTAPAPTSDMTTTSQAVLAAQPKSELGALEKIKPAARAARAEAPPKNNRVTQPAASPQNRLSDQFSIKGQ
jgi:hypothetical protein